MKRTGSGKQTQIYGLEGMRTLALLGVLLFHMFPRDVKGGYFGVILFFVISGFLTALNTVRRQNIPVVTYWKKRFLRIYPALIVMLFVTVEVIALADRFKLQNAQEEIASVLFAYNNYWQISRHADYFANLSANSAFTHLWYIAILIQFEVVWPLLYRLLKRMRHSTAVLGILVLVSMLVMPVGSFLPAVSQTQLYYGTLSRIHALLFGAWLGWKQALAEKRRIKRIKKFPALLASAVFLLVSIPVYRSAGGENIAVYRYGMVLYALFSGIMIAILSRTDRKTGVILDNPVCHFFSTYSYEIYLWQYPVLFAAGLIGMEKQYVLQIAVLLALSMWSHALPDFLRSVFARRRTN